MQPLGLVPDMAEPHPCCDILYQKEVMIVFSK
jgi:hypothetical protein